MGAYKIAGGMIYALLLEIRYVNNRSVRYDTSKRTGKVEKPCDNPKFYTLLYQFMVYNGKTFYFFVNLFILYCFLSNFNWNAFSNDWSTFEFV